ncbi:hypothetical protein PNK_1212 [Candidatus Protochlamydia naegleriophila]|uniref:Uncharacterized protein n=1 Tax=Candidatus Protochlamydia naegleriophila TaxID=389348 RepID=A0A0U5JCL1_9BACT|nr:hypothetical protein PNK_1212 [Candidatus Protochlamydia naegleriophila]
MPYSIKDFPILTNNFPLSDSSSQSQQRTQSSNFSRIRHPFKPLKNDARLSLSFILNSLVDSPPIRMPSLFLVESDCVKIQLQTSEGLYFGGFLTLKKRGPRSLSLQKWGYV